MPQLSDCIRWFTRDSRMIGPVPSTETVLQVKRNGAWVDVDSVVEESTDAAERGGQ